MFALVGNSQQGNDVRRQDLSLIRAFPGAAVLAVAATVAAAPAAAKEKKHAEPVGAVYTETNGQVANKVMKFDRYADGRIKRRQVIRTGGQGARQPQPGCDPPGGCPILDTSGEVLVTPNGRLVFAVNAGSNTISAFRETPHGMKRVDQQDSGGVFPESLTVHGNKLYVLNENSASIAGFRFSSTGKMKPIAGSVQSLSAGAENLPRQIGFDRTGRMVAVTLFKANAIDTFALKADGTPNPAVPRATIASSSALPFGFAFDPKNRLVVSQVKSLTEFGDTSTYGVDPESGKLTPIDTESSQGGAPCWVEITKDGRYVFVVNAAATAAPGGPTVTRYGLGSAGSLDFLGLTQPDQGEFARTDEALSRDSRYLYVLAPSVFGKGTSHIDQYRVKKNGNLKLIQATPSTLPPSLSGLDAF
jgi:6-phosphogluconolactonase (cycloisomerase 2 family)